MESLEELGGWFGMPELTLELLLGWLFSPLAFLLGVPWAEAVTAGSFIGQKLVVNEFVAYLNFAPYLAEGADVVLSPKTKAIVSFALCGFANLSSIAILLGGLGGMAPSRRKDIARMGLVGSHGRDVVQLDVGHHCRACLWRWDEQFWCANKWGLPQEWIRKKRDGQVPVNGGDSRHL